jgi:hypothetical protein
LFGKIANVVDLAIVLYVISSCWHRSIPVVVVEKLKEGVEDPVLQGGAPTRLQDRDKHAASSCFPQLLPAIEIDR